MPALDEQTSNQAKSRRSFHKEWPPTLFSIFRCDGWIRVYRALLNAILRDQMPGDKAHKPPINDVLRKQSKLAGHTRQHPKS